MSSENSNVMLLRIVSGVTAVMAIGVGIFRFLWMHNANEGTIVQALGLLFPLTIGIFFGYMAIKGKMPFIKKDE